MADERGMDLNLYLGLARSPLLRTLDLGSDLALGSLSEEMPPLPPPNNSNITTNNSPPIVSEEVHAPYSPSNSSFLPIDIDERDPNQEYNPYFPSDPPIIAEEPDSPPPRRPLRLLRIHRRWGIASDPPVAADGRNEESELPPTRTPPPRLLRVQRRWEIASDETEADEEPYSPPHAHHGWEVEAEPEAEAESSRPEVRFRRLMMRRRPMLRQFQPALPTSPDSEQLMLDIMSSQRSLEAANGKDKGFKAVEEEETEGDKKRNAANFECNVCLDMAKEPVVTSCGHLFCWPCLYQWLHVHSEHKECPVCKGEVTDSNVTPIYGRGSSESEVAQNGNGPGLRIPPRPHGNRLESLRQKFRPISRRFGEGIASSWRRFVNQQMRIRNNGLLGDGPHHILTRMRARRLMREGLNSDSGFEAEEIGVPRESTPIPPSGDESDIWNRFSVHGLRLAASDRLDALAAEVGRVVGNGNGYRASTSATNPLSPERVIPRSNVASAPSAEQASASSTIAVIQGDTGLADSSVEPNSAGSSRLHRRRERSSGSSSLDVDEGVLHARKRRRLN